MMNFFNISASEPTTSNLNFKLETKKIIRKWNYANPCENVYTK